MNKSITLTSTEAQTLYNTGRLIRTVDCDWQPPEGVTIEEAYIEDEPFSGISREGWVAVYPDGDGKYDHEVTPPLEVGAVYDVIEPCFSTEVRSNSLVITYGDSPIGKHASGTASRQQATPTYKLFIDEGKLRWYEELKRV